MVITGPTGSGKSRIALTLAQRLKGEIVNADSVQVYRDFDIGSGKPSAEELSQVPHHLYSEIPPDQNFDAGLFRVLATKKIDQLVGKGALPILVGGTGLYIRSLLCGLVSMGEITEEARHALAGREKELSSITDDVKEQSRGLHDWLREIDEQTAAQVHPADLCRVRRALLVRLSTGDSLSMLQAQHRHSERDFRALVMAMLPKREKLYQAIDARVDRMLAEGLVAETEKLRSQYPLNSRPFAAIGYRHVGLFLDGKLAYPEMIELLKRDTRRFAKRQMTWWRNQPEALGWERIDCVLTTGDGGDQEREISEHLIDVIESFLERKSAFTIDGIAFLPLENVDVV